MGKKRNSSIELLRIIMILSIIAHHLLVNSQLYIETKGSFSIKYIIMFVFGMGGKIGLNVFLIISGYFMCKSYVTVLRWLKLFIEIMFYSFVINIIFIIIGYKPFGTSDIIKGLFPFVFGLGMSSDYYPALFLVLLLIIPFINKLIEAISKKEFQVLLVILIFIFTVVSSFSFIFISTINKWTIVDVWEGVAWYATAYMVGAYIRLYFNPKFDNLKNGLISTIACIVLAISSVVLLAYLNCGITQYHFVARSNKILAILTAVSLFILFKNINMPYNRFVNTVASATFGVLLLHSNNLTLRNMIWDKIFRVKRFVLSNAPIMLIKMIATVLILYIVCVIISLLVKRVILEPIYKKLATIEILNKKMYTD